jgi:Flp pilus assembly protein TadG
MNRLSLFFAHRDGNFAIMSSLISLPVLLGVGLALDYSTISRTRSDLQESLDAAVLAIAREGNTISDQKARHIAELFAAQNSRLKITDLNVVHDETSFRVQGVVNAPTAFGNLFGYDGWPVKASSTADIAYAAYEVGLVLDTTGSMAGGKLAAMKEAVNDLIDGMAQQSEKDKLKFALVPFATFVNVGPQYAPSFDKKGKVVKNTGATWLDIEGRTPIPQVELEKGMSRFEAFNNLKEPWAGCVETRVPTAKVAFDVEDRTPSKKDKSSLFVPAFNIDEPDGGGYSNSYIASDVDPLDKSAKAKKKKMEKYGAVPLIDSVTGAIADLAWTPVTAEISGGKGPNASCTSQPLVPLTNDYQSLKDKVSALQAKGTTNIMEGVMWGWRVLSPGEPFTEGKPRKDNPNLHKLMIVLTDGSNNLGVNRTTLGSDYSSQGYLVDGRLGITTGSNSDATARMNERTLSACGNAKKDGVEIYTIRLEEPDVRTGMMLKECASDEAHFYDAPSRSQLGKIFDAIKTGITKVRLSS